MLELGPPMLRMYARFAETLWVKAPTTSGFGVPPLSQKLLQHPELINSQLLADFLSPHSMESQFLDKMLPDVNLGTVWTGFESGCQPLGVNS